jgi:predicted HTH domain antitoxin
VEADEFLFGIEVSLEATVVHIEIPRKVLYAARMTASELQRELAVHLFAEGTLSFGKGREVANMCFWEFQQLLASRRIPVHCDIEEYEEDLAVLSRLEAAWSSPPHRIFSFQRETFAPQLGPQSWSCAGLKRN